MPPQLVVTRTFEKPEGHIADEKLMLRNTRVAMLPLSKLVNGMLDVVKLEPVLLKSCASCNTRSSANPEFFTTTLAVEEEGGPVIITSSIFMKADEHPTLVAVLSDVVCVVDFTVEVSEPKIIVEIEIVIAIRITDAISGETPFMIINRYLCSAVYIYHISP
jgi:hypothetical protein